MTDRPRTWLLVECLDCGRGASAHRIEGGPVWVVEWDRGKVEAVIRSAFTEWEVSVIRAALEHSGPLPDEAERAQGVATAIFDALDPEG